MKYFKTQNLYKASNVTFNPSTVSAHSYEWWEFVKVIRGKIVFNDYKYSKTTIKHQYKVKRLMEELGITTDLTIETSRSLSEFKTLTELKAAHAHSQWVKAEKEEESKQ